MLTVTCETAAFLPHSEEPIRLANAADRLVMSAGGRAKVPFSTNGGRQAGVEVEIAALAPFWVRAVANHVGQSPGSLIDLCTQTVQTDQDGVAVAVFGDDVTDLVDTAWEIHHVVLRSTDPPPDGRRPRERSTASWVEAPEVSAQARGGGDTGQPLVGRFAANTVGTRFVPLLDQQPGTGGRVEPGPVNVPPVGQVTARMPGAVSPWPIVLSEGVEAVTVPLAVDPATVVVGHTTATTARIWVRLHAALDEHWLCRVSVREAGGLSLGDVDALRGQSLRVDLSRSPDRRTGVVEFSDLTPGARHSYLIAAERPPGTDPGSRFVLETGEFRTLPEAVERLELAFGSCHGPLREPDPAPDLLWAWEELDRLRPEVDRLLLLGDQVYADDVPAEFRRRPEILTGYSVLYDLHWDFAPVREVLKAGPTYMVADDHDIDDDWGTIPLGEHKGGAERVAAGIDALKIFQRWHGPNGRDGDPFFRVDDGFASILVPDLRSYRDPSGSAGSAVLGAEQRERLLDWARSEEVRAATVVVFAPSIPLGFLGVDAIRALLVAIGGSVVDRADHTVGGVLGALAGGLVGGLGPLGAGLAGAGWIIGSELGDDAGESIVEDMVDGVLEDSKNSPDLEDQWTWSTNQEDLDWVLTLLFDLANGLDPANGLRRDPKRLVLSLGGDVHVGCIHELRSRHGGGHRDHRGNDRILQVTSSALTREPPSELLFHAAARHARDEWQGGADELTEDPASFTIGASGMYELNLVEHAPGRLAYVPHRNVGRISVAPDVRDRRLALTAELRSHLGEESSVQVSHVVDLDAARVWGPSPFFDDDHDWGGFEPFE